MFGVFNIREVWNTYLKRATVNYSLCVECSGISGSLSVGGLLRTSGIAPIL